MNLVRFGGKCPWEMETGIVRDRGGFAAAAAFYTIQDLSLGPSTREESEIETV